MVRRVRPVLGFQAQCSVLNKRRSIRSMQAAIKKIAGIELNTRFHRKHLHLPPAGGIIQRGGMRQRVAAAVKNEVMIVPAFHLVYTGPDPVRLGKIKGRTFDRCNLPCGNKLIVHRGISLGVQHQHVVQDRRRGIAREIKIAVIR